MKTSCIDMMESPTFSKKVERCKSDSNIIVGSVLFCNTKSIMDGESKSKKQRVRFIFNRYSDTVLTKYAYAICINEFIKLLYEMNT